MDTTEKTELKCDICSRATKNLHDQAHQLLICMFTIDEICDIWHSCYGEDLKEEYSGFIDALKFTIVMQSAASKKVPPKLLEKMIFS